MILKGYIFKRIRNLKPIACAPYCVIPFGEKEPKQVFFSKLNDGDSIVFRLVYQGDLGINSVKDCDTLYFTEDVFRNFFFDICRQSLGE